jgi:hypothetical protein
MVKNHLSKKPVHSTWLAHLIFNPEDGGDTFSETLVHIQTTWRYFPEGGNIHKCIINPSYIKISHLS